MCFNILRSRKVRRNISLESIGDEDSRMELPDRKAELPEKGLNDKMMSEIVTEAVNRLPENQRLAIILNKFEDRNYKEIAETLNTTTLAVKSLLSRARENLRHLLRNHMDLD